MITIAMDEQGKFEEFYETGTDGNPVFIGGIIFDDYEDDKEYRQEKERIHHYLKAICEEVGATYPADLHVNNTGNAAKVRQVKMRIAETLSEFLISGKCELIENEQSEKLNKMPERTGRYYVFANMMCNNGGQEISLQDSMLAREDFASNLYVLMAEDVVERMIFHNPVIKKIEHVRPELATRRVVLEGGDCDEKVEQYQKLGYQEDSKYSMPGKRIFILTNKENYRTAIQREMMDTEKKYIQIDEIGVKSIYYGQESANNRMEFLYLADIICSNLGYQLPKTSPGELLEEFKRRADEYTGHSDNQIFVHDVIDREFQKAWNRLEEKDYYNCVRIAYELMQMENPYAVFYGKVWVEKIKERLREERSLSDYKIAVDRLYDYTRQNNMDQGKLLFLFSILEEMKDTVKYNNSMDQAVIYKLYDCGVSAYCHLGKTRIAEQYFEKCREYAKYIDFETYIRTRNKLAVCLGDEFQYEKAEKLAQENQKFYKELIPLRRLITEDDEEQTLNYGIICSQLAQTQAFQRKEEAEENFIKALEQMEKGTPNYYITMSYLLHFYLDMNMEKKYSQMSVEYFGGKRGLREQFQYILEEGNKGRSGMISMKFALYVFVKGIYKFYMNKIGSPQMLRKLLHIEDMIQKSGEEAGRQIGGHPWEIIYKYLAFIAWDQGYEEEAEQYIEKISSAVKYQGPVVEMISWYGKFEFSLHKEDKENTGKKIRQKLCDLSTTVYEDPILMGCLSNDKSIEETYEKLSNQVFTYMYC